MNESFDLKGYITTGTFSVATSFNHDFRSKFETKIKHCSNVENLKPHLNLYIFIEKCAKKMSIYMGTRYVRQKQSVSDSN